MAVTAKMYGQALMKALNKEINWTNDSIMVMLCTSAYVPDQDAHVYKSSVTNEATGTGYVAGGVAITNKTMTYNAPTNTIVLDGDDSQWLTATITARYAVIYDATPSTDATRPLLGYVDFGSDQSSSAGTFKLQWDSAGIFNLIAS